MSESAGPGETPGDAVRGRQNVLALDVPPRMTAIVDESEDPLPVELMAAVNTREGYTPTLVATVFGYEGGQPLFTRSALEGLERDLVSPHIIGVADWEPPASWNAPETGCVIDYTQITGEDEQLVFGRDYLAVAQGWAVQVTTTSTPQDRFIMDALLEEGIRGLSILRTPTTQDAVTVLAGPVPLGTSATGHQNRIDLGPWRERAAWTRPEAVSLQPASLEVLASMDLDEPVLPDDADLLRDLTGAGLLGPGGLSGDALFLSEVLQVADAGLSVTMYRDGRQSALTCAMFGETTAVLWGPSYGQLAYGHPGEASERRSGAAVIPTAELSSTVCGWLGLGPAWTDDESPVLTSPDLVDRIVSGDTVDLEAFGPNASLYLWHINTWAGERSLDDAFALNAGPRGHFQVRADTAMADSIVLWPADSSWVARMIEDRVQAAYFDRPVTLDA
ncbi:hypothetical protein [Citricoccus nitrophenolicus]|uniref:hypothetical protein n=1 Tax=Citricoccus nitrophenolicus TaxID=863575 RepID=UPI0039B5282F